MRTILGFTLVVLPLCSSLAADDKKDETIDAKKLVGKWKPKEKIGDATFVVEFLIDGLTTATFNKDGKETKLEGKYKVEGNKLTTRMKVGDEQQPRIQTITKLTDTELVTTDENGKEATMVRIKDK